MSTQTMADSVGVGLPDVWTRLPLDEQDFAWRLDQMMETLREEGLPTSQIRTIELVHRQLRDQLRSENVVLAATMFGRSQESEGEEASLLTASLGVMAKTRSELGSPAPLSVGLLLRAVADDDEVRELEPPQRVRLPIGEALRLQRLHQLRTSPNVSVPFIGQSYLVPIDGGERLLTIQFATPNVELREVFAELFEAIARTVRVFRPGEATTFDDPTPATDGEDDG